EIKVSVARKLLRPYREFYNEKSGELRNDKKSVGAVKYAPEDMGNALSDLFFGSGYGSASTSISSSLSESRTSFSR
ncbi:exocyst complex component EXO70A1-like protein, partial [Tanacetum coccineum]